MRKSLSLYLPLILFLFNQGCAGVERSAKVDLPPPPELRAVVFSADGAGGFNGTTRALREAACDCKGIHVVCVDWTHGTGRIIADQVDRSHADEEGRKLAEQVKVWRANRPDVPVFLVGHSAGSAVVLNAVASLPAGSVERVILLAPSVSADYDLRPALRRIRSSVDVFYSNQDWASLGLGVAIVGTADRRWTAAAGRVGFRPIAECPEDRELYTKLRQHRWDPSMSWSGHLGGHYGPTRTTFLRAYVTPLLKAG
jgi:pimeloyl-ACP methyl ester carboxylesterase